MTVELRYRRICLIMRMGSWGIPYSNSKQEPQNSIGNYLGSYKSWTNPAEFSETSISRPAQRVAVTRGLHGRSGGGGGWV